MAPFLWQIPAIHRDVGREAGRVRGLSQAEHIVGLGARSDHIATVPQLDAQRLRLTDDEVVLLAQVGRVATIEEVLARSGYSEPQTIALLLSLRAKGAITPARVPKAATLPPPAVLSAAASEEVDLDPQRKAEILALEARLEDEDHFALLGVPRGAEPAEAKRAFYELSKRLHPDRFYGRSIGSFRARIERVYRRLSEAHGTLTDPAKRQAFLAAHPHLARPAATPAPYGGAEGSNTPPPAGGGRATPAPRTAVEEERDAERRARLARHPYLMRAAKLRDVVAQARAHAEKGEYEAALAELSRLQQADPANREVAALLAEVRKRFEGTRAVRELERGKAALREGDSAAALAAFRLAASLDTHSWEAAFLAAEHLRRQGGDVKEVRLLAQRAAELAPRKPDPRVLLGLVLLETGAKKTAKAHFEAALELDPEHAEARAQLKKLRWVF